MAHLESSLIKTDNTALAHTAATLSYFRVDRKQQRGRDEIRLPSSPVKLLALHVGPKVGVCEVGIEANFGEDCFNCHGSL